MLKAVPLFLSSMMLLAQAPAGNWLLTNANDIQAAKQKAEKYAWAKQAYNKLIADAERAVKAKIEMPDRGGQWPHWYSCKKDGAKLVAETPTRHRCPACGEVYTGEPYDSVVLYGVHSRHAGYIRDCGLAYRFTGRPEFARRAAELLTAYADKYNTYKLHNTRGQEAVGGGRIMAQTLDESVWLIPAAWGYALVRDTIAPADQKHIEKDLFVAAADVIRQHKMSIHNIQCWKNSAVGIAGLVAGNPELVREAIEDPTRGFLAQMEKGVTDDGLWYEGSMGYHTYTMQAIWPLAEAARRAGRNLFSERMSLLWDAPLKMALPSGDSPGFNDNAGGNVTRMGSLYELAFARWHKAEYGALVARSDRNNIDALLFGVAEPAKGPITPTASSLLKDAGFAVLRGGDVAVAMRFGRHGGGHGHPDKLNVVTFGKGVLFGLDPGSINYGVPLHREWYRSSVAHNTVVVDGKEQTTADGTLEKWDAAPGATTIIAAANQAYPGVQLRRTVRVDAKGLVNDRFECTAEGEHTYDWVFHAAGAVASSLTFAARTEPLGAANGYQHIKQVASAVTGEPFWVSWKEGNVTMTLRMEGAPGTEVIRGVGPGRNPTTMVPMIIVRRKAAKTVFEAVHSVNQ